MTIDIKKLAAQPFQIDGLVVYAKRGEIHTLEQSISLEPKVMLVLLNLAAQHHQVVNQEDLFNAVWPRSIFSPNSLRRCISTLRKVLGDVNKNILSTHPKIGYSLNVEPVFIDTFPQKVQKPVYKAISLFGLMCCLTVAVWALDKVTQDKQSLYVDNMEPITATEEIEDFIALSPNEQILAFSRYQSNNLNSGVIWLKNLTTSSEVKLSLPPAHRRNLTWSTNGNSIFFVQVTQTGWQIKQVDVSKDVFEIDGEHTVHEKILLDNPDSHWISSIQASTNQKLYFIAKDKQNSHLFEFDIITGSTSILLESSPDFRPYELALARTDKSLAVTGQSDDGQDSLKLIDLNNGNLGKIKQTISLGEQQRFSIQWLKGNQLLLLNNGHRLFYLTLQGQLEKLDYEQSQFIRFSIGALLSNNIYLVSSALDNDLLILNKGAQQAQNLVNSTAMDYLPSISPDDQKVAYYSTRYGRPQLFLHDMVTNKDYPMFDNPSEHLNVDKPAWSHTGNRLAFSMGQQVFYMSMTNETKHEFSPQMLPEIQGMVLGWYPDNASILISQRVSNRQRLIRVNVDTNETRFITEITEGHPYLSLTGEILFIKNKSIYHWQPQKKLAVVASFEHEIVRYFPTKKGVYLQFVNNDANWQLWSNKTQNVVEELNLNSVYRVAAISHNEQFAIVTQHKKTSDIVKLTLKERE